MIKQIGEIIHKAIDEAPFKVMIIGSLYSVMNGFVVVFSSPLHDQAEDMMDAFNDAWIARKVVEGMRMLSLNFTSVYDKNCWDKICKGLLNDNKM